MSQKITCGEFVYGGDQDTLGHRWTDWLFRFDLYVTANNLTDAAIIKSSFLLLMGKEALQIYMTLKKTDNSDVLSDVKKFMSSHFGPKHSEYTEICKFIRAMKNKHETVSEYATRLRNLAQHCKFEGLLEKEIERQFVVGCGMPEVERKCVRTDDLDLKKLLELALGYERAENCVRGLHNTTEGEMGRGTTINYTIKGHNKLWEQKARVWSQV